MSQNKIQQETYDDPPVIMEHMVIRTSGKIRGERLDKYLQRRFGQFSRTRIQYMIKEQVILVNGNRAKGSTKINPDDLIELDFPKRGLEALYAEDIPLDVVYEDDDILLINKQADLIIHPTKGNHNGTLINGLIHYSQRDPDNKFRPGIVHRLDKDTTGIIIIAKSDVARYSLGRQFENKIISKTYLALVHGKPERLKATIDAPIGQDPGYKERCAVIPEGKRAITHYEVVEDFGDYSLIKIDLETGRTHQIRVHMSYNGTPLVADTKYGGKIISNDNTASMERVALHAWRLKLVHPSTNEEMAFVAEVHTDMYDFLEQLRNSK